MKLCGLDSNDPGKGATLGFFEHGIEFSHSTKEGIVGRNIPVGTVTCYGLDNPGIKFQLGQDISHLSTPALWCTQPPV
jgi:hypothetical protein